MSMIGNLLRVSNAELQTYLADSIQLENRLYQDAGRGPALVDIDKTWEGVLFLLTGRSLADIGLPEAADSLVRVLFSGQLIDAEQNLGYGPAHYLRPAEVAQLEPRLAAIGLAELRARFDPAKMMALGIYPEIWDEGEDAFAYLTEGFATVQQLYAEAARNGEAVITYIS